jgi:hypothetical protein
MSGCTTYATPMPCWRLADGAYLKTAMYRMGRSHMQTTQKDLRSLPDAEDPAMAPFQPTRAPSGHVLVSHILVPSELEPSASPGTSGW